MKNVIVRYAKLVKERAEQIKKLESTLTKEIIRGSIRIQGNRCGTKGCRCKRKNNPILHGPYAYLSYRGKKSNHSILLTKNKDIIAKQAIKNYRELMDGVIKLSDIDFQILRYYSNRFMDIR